MLNREPTVIINGLSELLRQIIPLLVLMGIIKLSPEKQAGLISIIGLILAFISTTLLRSQVVSTGVANSQIQTGINASSDTTVKEVIAIEKENRE